MVGISNNIRYGYWFTYFKLGLMIWLYYSPRTAWGRQDLTLTLEAPEIILLLLAWLQKVPAGFLNKDGPNKPNNIPNKEPIVLTNN